MRNSNTVVLSNRVKRSIQRELVGTDESEKCGFLLGWRVNQEIHVQNIRPAENVYRDKYSFAISSREYANVLQNTECPEELVGIYHTHHGTARIGYHDRSNLVVHSFLWLIVGVGCPTLEWRCFKHDCGRIQELRVSLEGS